MNITEWLKNNWFLFSAIMAAGVAWGANDTKIKTVEEAVKMHAQTEQEIVHLKEGQAKLDERTQQMLKAQERQEQLLQGIIRSQERIIRQTR